MAQNYLLKHDDVEAERLTQQHKMWTVILEYRIHPSILTRLPANARIADVATGNGAWLLDVAHSDDQPSWTMDGFDISSSQFPKRSAATTNIHFHELDMKKPFPPPFLHKYDLVHVRLVLVALEADEWSSTLANLCTLLKPDGWIQWEEADVRPASVALKSHWQCDTGAVQEVMYLLMEELHDKMPPASNRFRTAFETSVLEEVQYDVLATDRLPEYRPLGTRVLMGVAHAVHKQRANSVALGFDELASFEGLLERANEEVDKGAYVTYRINAFRGRLRIENTEVGSYTSSV